MADWRKVANNSSILCVVVTSLMTVYTLLLAFASVGLTAFGYISPPLMFTILMVFAFLLCVGQITVDAFMIMSSYPEAVTRNRNQCHCRVLAFLIYSAVNIIYNVAMMVYTRGDIIFIINGIAMTILAGLCVPFFLELQKPPPPQQQFQNLRPSELGDSKMHIPSNANTAGYPLLVQETYHPQGRKSQP